MPKQNDDDPRIDYLCKAENFACAYDVNELFPKVVEALVGRFSERVSAETLSALAKQLDWKVDCDLNAAERNNTWWLRPREIPKQSRYCMPVMELGLKDGSLHYGICWDDEVKEPQKSKIARLAAVQELQKTLKKNGFEADDIARWDWWLGLKYLEDFKRRAVLERIAESDGAFERSIVDEFVEFAKEVAAPVKSVNRAVGKEV